MGREASWGNQNTGRYGPWGDDTKDANVAAAAAATITKAVTGTAIV
jgi:hypothetical protein